MQRQSGGRLTLGRSLLILVVLILAGGVRVGAQQKPTCLLVMNQTRFVVEVFAMTPSGPQSRGMVNPGSEMRVYNVNNGDQFRAVWREGSETEQVQLVFDGQYGGWIHRWRVPRSG